MTLLAILMAVTKATSYDRYDYGYGIYDDGYDSPTIDISPGFLESMKAFNHPPNSVNSIVYKRVSSDHYPAQLNAIHFYYVYPRYPQVYPFHH